MSQEKSSTPSASQSEGDTKKDKDTSTQPEVKQEQPSSIHQDVTRPTAPFNVSEAGGPLPEIDEGPRPGPVDEIQEAIFEAAQDGLPTEVELDELAAPELDVDEGPRAEPVDEVQEAIFSAAQEGMASEVDFDTLPEPTAPPTPKKVIKFQKKAAPAKPEEPSPAELPPELPEAGPEPEPVSTISDYWFLLTLFVTFRLLTLFLLRPGGFIRDWSDFDTYFGIAAMSDYSLFPFVDFWLEWPPLIPWLAVGAYKLALLLPPWTDDPRLWFILILGGVFVLFEIGNFVLIYRLARRLFQAPATVNRVMWFYAGLFPPVYAMLGFFDGIALFFILLALDLILDDRRALSAIAIGVGFMVKIIPVLMLPVALRRLWYQYRENNREAGIEAGLYAVIVGLVILALLGPFLVSGPQWILASARSMLGRASWETVWAIMEGYYGFGAVAGDRLNPAETNFAVHEGWLPWWLITLAFVGLYGYIFTRSADYSRPRKVIAFAGLTTTIFMLSNKGYSPQFLVYLLPFILLLLPDGRGLTYALILTGLNVLEQPVYFVMLPNESWLLVFIVIARFLVTTILALEFAVMLWPSEERLAPLIKIRPYVPIVLGSLAGLALVVLTPFILRAYTTSQLTDSPVGAFAGFMESQIADSQSDKPRLLLSDQATYRQLYPHLRDALDLQLADGTSKAFPGTPTVPDLLRGFDQVWILPTGPQERALRNAVSARAAPLASYHFEGFGTASLYTLQPNPIPLIAPARFTGGIELLAHQIELEPEALEVKLYWRANTPQSQNLTVFTQVLNEDGLLVGSHDSIPRNGTAPVTTWPVDAVQADLHRIELPTGLSPGEYRVIIGLYNDFDERLPAIGPDGLSYPNRAVPLEVVTWP